MNAVRLFLSRIRKSGVKCPGEVRTVAMGRERVFEAYDIGEDTYIFERGVSNHLEERPSVIIADKSDLRRRSRGHVLTMTTGNHSVAAFPLLDGRFWRLSTLKAEVRGEVLMNRMLAANVVGHTIEISQRDVSTARLIQGDAWLTGTAGFSIADIVMAERNDATLDHYRRLGQEWRVKPLAWTEVEMKTALAASRKRIAAGIRYYHSIKGVHFLTYPEFLRFAERAQTDPDGFVKGLRELVSVFEGNRTSFTRMIKHRGHHEIEFFGLKRGIALTTIVPELEKLMESITFSRMGQLGIMQKAGEISALFASNLARAAFADETSRDFTETLYMYITGEIYSVVGEGATPAFDDRRTALPGATFVAGRPVLHPGADTRSEVLLSNLRGMLSKGEFVEYANVYELREDETTPIGRGHTREIVYKTNMRPLEASFIEKGLSSRRKGYAEYMLARIGSLRALGIGMSSYYRLLRRRAGGRGTEQDYYIRTRCEGESMDSIPANYFHSVDDASVESVEAVTGLAVLMGDAAAQNLAMKKFDPKTESPLFGIGKEIYEFEYDLIREQVVPKKVTTCSIRGTFGWPYLDYTDSNLQAIAAFYLTHFAHALKVFQRQHTVDMRTLAEHFMNGFEFRIHTMSWQLSVMRDRFEDFHPPVKSGYGFDRKWRFAMWALERHERRLPILRKTFFEKVNLIERKDNEDLRSDSEPVRLQSFPG